MINLSGKFNENMLKEATSIRELQVFINNNEELYKAGNVSGLVITSIVRNGNKINTYSRKDIGLFNAGNEVWLAEFNYEKAEYNNSKSVTITNPIKKWKQRDFIGWGISRSKDEITVSETNDIWVLIRY